MKNYTFKQILPAGTTVPEDTWPVITVAAPDVKTAETIIVEDLAITLGLTFLEESNLNKGQSADPREITIRSFDGSTIARTASEDVVLRALDAIRINDPLSGIN